MLVALEAASEQKCTMQPLWCNRCAAPVVKVVNAFVWGWIMKAEYRGNNTAYWTLQRRWRLQTAGKASNYGKQWCSIHLLHIMIPINWLALEHFIDLHNTTMLWVFFFEALAMFMRMFILMWACAHSRSQPKGLSGLKRCTVASWSSTHPTPPSCRKRMKCSNSWMDVVEKKSRWGSMPQDFFPHIVDSGHTHLRPCNSSNVSGAQTLNQIVHADPHVRPPAFEALAATLRGVQDLQKSNNIYCWKKSSSCKIFHNIQL